MERREETPLRSALDAPRCLNCGAALAGPYCAACGQHVRSERLSLGHVARQAAGELSPVDHGIVFTALAVLTRPGRMAREYVEGRTVRYVGPVKYFMLLVGNRPQLAAENQPAVAVDGGQRSAEIVNRARQKVCTILIVFLQLEIGVQQALQNLIAIRPQRLQV